MAETAPETTPPDTVPPPVTSSSRPARAWARRWIADDRAWLLAALATTLLIGWGGEEASPLAWLNPIVFLAALLVRWRDAGSQPSRLPLRGWPAVAVVIVVGWAVGMVIELTITTDGDGFGGLHPETGPSFILAQGYYLPAVLFTWAAVRRYGLDTRRAFFFAGAMAWWEALTVGLVAMISPWFPLAALLGAYYVSTYALCGMGGLLVIDHRALRAPRSRTIGTRRLVAYGMVAGAASWAMFLIWASVASRLFGFSL